MLEQLGRDRYEDTLSFHNALVRSVLAEHGGIEVDRHGSGFFAVFAHVMDAIAAAVELRRAAEAASWPHDAALRVCLGIHTGDADVGTEGYVGLAVHEAARLAQTADGGHILLSATTAALVGDDLDETLRLNDLGEWPLAGFEGRRRLYSLTADPDHTVVMPSRLRATGDPRLVLLERERELMTIEALVRGQLTEGFVVLEGRAGIGKTRLVQAARDAAADAGLQVLFARGAELEQDFGYGVVRQLFEPVLATATEAERADLLAGPPRSPSASSTSPSSPPRWTRARTSASRCSRPLLVRRERRREDADDARCRRPPLGGCRDVALAHLPRAPARGRAAARLRRVASGRAGTRARAPDPDPHRTRPRSC